jgi:FtsP/CotA-like multicopper oxidase with cupredoxin domain
MKTFDYIRSSMIAILSAVLLFFSGSTLYGAINGVTGTDFSFTAKVDYVNTADGGRMLLWGLADNGGRAQYPAPTLIVNQGDTITINLKNELTVKSGTVPNVSLVFPGQDVTASCAVYGLDTCPQGALTLEAEPDGDVVSYTFTADRPGTFTYHSGTNPALQIEMGITGAIIVRPTGFNANAPTAYEHAGSSYTREELFFLTEMDPNIHLLVERRGPDAPGLKPMLDNYFSNYFFLNGRTAPDDLAEASVPWLPTQPYNSVPRMHPGETVLMRVVVGGRDMHPFHHHGNHARVIARDAQLLLSQGTRPDISTEGFTISTGPGKTVDALFTWTGEGLGWDIYGGNDVNMDHECNGIPVDYNDPLGAVSAGFDPITHEYCPDHGKPLPVILPGNQELTFGGWWGGSPYLGSLGALPPGEGGLNPNGGFSFMWHSHTEKELTNWDIYPGGMLTMMIIENPTVVVE